MMSTPTGGGTIRAPATRTLENGTETPAPAGAGAGALDLSASEGSTPIPRPRQPPRGRCQDRVLSAAVPVAPGWSPPSLPRWELPWRTPLPEAYLVLAHDYQRRTTLFPGWRELVVARLRARPGDTVIDVGAGPGLNLAALRAAVGPHGTIIAVEQSPELLAVAAATVTRQRWANVELINAPAATVNLSLHADAALFATAHHVIADPATVSNMIGQLRPNAVVAAGGWKWPTPLWGWPLRGLVSALHRPHPGEVSGLAQPWRALAEHRALQVDELGFGTGYLAYTDPTTPTTDTATSAGSPSLEQPTRRPPGSREEWFHDQLTAVMDPLARRCQGQPVAVVRPILARVWWEEVGSRLREPVLSDCAAALAQGQPWTQPLWCGGWSTSPNQRGS